MTQVLRGQRGFGMLDICFFFFFFGQLSLLDFINFSYDSTTYYLVVQVKLTFLLHQNI